MKHPVLHFVIKIFILTFFADLRTKLLLVESVAGRGIVISFVSSEQKF
jgi:hypothetical protein